jgi:hypothetical protein
MKKTKLLLFPVLMCLLASPALGQKGLKLGAFLQPQASVLYNDYDQSLDEDDYRLGILDGIGAGLSLGYDFNDYIGFRLQGIYSLQGGKYTNRRDINTRNTYVTRLEYLKVPLMLHFNSNPTNRKAVFVFEAGAQLGLLTRAWEYNDNPAFDPGIPSNFSNFPTTKETFVPYTVSLVGGIGFDVRLNYDLQMNLRLMGDYTLQDVEDKDQTYRVSQNGNTVDAKYWEWARDITRNAETYGITGGLLIGVTWMFSNE